MPTRKPGALGSVHANKDEVPATPRAGAGLIPSRYRDFATSLQREAIDAINRHSGNQAAAARELGIRREAIRDRITLVKIKAARAGYSPEHDYTHVQPDGFHVGGVTTQYGADGEVERQWVKSAADKEQRIELLRESLGGLVEPYRGTSDRSLIKMPKHCANDTMNVIPLGDPHIGMLAWAIETGADFDLQIAERNMVTGVDQLVSLAPPSKLGWLINLGDFFHTDNGSNRTNASGHVLDVDSRYPKMCRVGLRAIRRCIDRMLEKHEQVRVTCEIGNHDDYSSIWLAITLGAYYENNPRVVIDDAPTWAHFHRFGECLIGATHGHGPKHATLGEIMANDRKKDWGETTFRHWYVGHVHHDSAKERLGCKIETVRTLAGRDAWHTREGYRAMRDLKLDVWHAKRGLKVRHIIGVEEIEALAA
jgi:hypothetical protein